MRFRIASLGIVLLTATAVLAQDSPSASAPASMPVSSQARPFPPRRPMAPPGSRIANGKLASATLNQRVEEMQATLAKMHAVLKQMQAKSAKNPNDSLAKANLDMWALMMTHMDKQLEELRTAAAAREDMDARRAALYKQADAKAEAAAAAARKAKAAQAPVTPTAGPAAPASTPPAVPAASSPSPN